MNKEEIAIERVSDSRYYLYVDIHESCFKSFINGFRFEHFYCTECSYRDGIYNCCLVYTGYPAYMPEKFLALGRFLERIGIY